MIFQIMYLKTEKFLRAFIDVQPYSLFLILSLLDLDFRLKA